ncbi:MAG TPA: amidase [Sphingomicrobium sp.]|nr:amidase [Sphingomicrobium sp.]
MRPPGPVRSLLSGALALLIAGCATSPQPSAEIFRPALDQQQPPPLRGPAEAGTRAALDRIAALNPLLRAVIATDPSAIEQARNVDSLNLSGPLAGKPVLIKDNIEVAGALPTTAGSLALLGNITNRDAPVVARLRSAGAVILGKSNLSEWANFRSSNSLSGWSAVGGQALNPYALDRNPCGSSSGSATAVASGMVRLAIGTETDGSVTCPAAINGVVGMKPTIGLVSRTHIIPISASQDTAGPLAASVREAADLLTAIAGSDPADPATRDADLRKSDFAAALDPNALAGKRIGVLRFASGFGTDRPFERALAILRESGAVLVEIDKVEDFDEDAVGFNEFQVLLAEFKHGLNAYLATTPGTVATRTLADLIAFNRANHALEMGLFGQDIFEKAQRTKGLADPAYKKARRASFTAASGAIDGLLEGQGLVALVGPTVSPAWKIDPVNGDQVPGSGAGNLAAVAGYPHLTVPMGMVKGLPVGLSFIGPKWSDSLILALGYAYEQARGPFPAPGFLPAIEITAEIAPLLEPQAR